MNPHGQSPTDFRTNYGFHRRPAKQDVWGLDYPFAVPRIIPRFRRCPSSLYTF